MVSADHILVLSTVFELFVEGHELHWQNGMDIVVPSVVFCANNKIMHVYAPQVHDGTLRTEVCNCPHPSLLVKLSFTSFS